MSKKHEFEEDTKNEAFITPSAGTDDSKAADADIDIDDLVIEVDYSEVEEEADHRAPGHTPETD
jgi:hypothetical protein